MNDCRTCKDRMIEALYGELGPADKERFDQHLSTCPECASEYSLLGATIRLMDKRERPDPGPEFWEGYWDRLSRRRIWEEIGEDDRPSFAARLVRVFSRLPRWPYQAENFIERSKVLLLGLVNYDPVTEDAYALDLDRKKTMSRELAAQAPAIRGALNDRGQKRLRGLVSDLEVNMMQIANLGAGQDLEGVELIKQGVDSRGIFLKIDLDRMGRDARGQVNPASPPGEAKLPKKNKT